MYYIPFKLNVLWLYDKFKSVDYCLLRWKVWFSNRRAKWRREEKLRSQRREVDAGVGSGLDVTAGFGSRLNISAATGATGFSANSCAGMYPTPTLVHQPLVSVAAVAADPYRYHELADLSSSLLLSSVRIFSAFVSLFAHFAGWKISVYVLHVSCESHPHDLAYSRQILLENSLLKRMS